VEEVRYMISEASKRIDVEAHVLRYWQKELNLPISRNEMEQRYYKETDIELFRKVKQLKEQGFQLKAIKMLLPNLNKQGKFDAEDVFQQNGEQKENVIVMLQEDGHNREETGTSLMATETSHGIEETSEVKLGQFNTIMNQIIMSALKENNGVLSEEIGMNVTGNVIKEMNYLMRIREEKEEERYKKFDSTLRDYQTGRLMAAATIDGRKRKKSKFFKKNRINL